MCLRSLKMCLLLALLVGFVHLLIIVVCSSRSSGQAMDRNQDEEKNQVQQFQQQLGHPEGIPENDKTKENLENEKGVHEEDEDVRIVSDGEQNVTRVILPSYMRSGSSFTASLFNQHRDVFYIYEPLWNYDFAFKRGQVMTYLDGTPSVTYDKDNSTQMDTLKKDTIRAYLSCHLQHIGSLDFAVMQKPWAKARTKRIQDFLACWHPVNDLQSLKKCLPLIQRDCDTAKVTVVKTLRFTMTQALTLMKSDPRVKVVHLVRDPRAVMYSRKVTGVGWGYHETFQYLCGRILQDVQDSMTIRKTYPDRVLTIRYEDLTSDPLRYTQQLLRFANLDFSPQHRDYVTKITSAKGAGNKSVSVRDTSRVSGKWRGQISVDFVKDADQHCGPLYEAMGHLPFPEERVLRNLSQPAYVSCRDIEAPVLCLD